MSVVPANKSTSLAVKLDDKALEAIENIVSQCNVTALQGMNRIKQALMMAAGIAALEKMLTEEVMKDVMKLQGTKLGFRTDKDQNGGYPVDVVRRNLIEALLRGAWPVGNEFNIIANNMYLTKEYFIRTLRELEGFTDLILAPGLPKMLNGGAVVPYRASWKYHGKPGLIERDIPIKVNNGMGADAILGKAERKIRCAIYNQCTGSELSDGEVDESNIVATIPAKTLDQVADKINGKSPEQAKTELEAAGDETDSHGEILPNWLSRPVADLSERIGVARLSRLKHVGIRTLGELRDKIEIGDRAALGFTKAEDFEHVKSLMAELETEALAEREMQQA